MIGFGPIQPYLDDPEVTEVMVNAPDEIFVEKEGQILSAPVSFRDHEHIQAVIERIIAPVGRRIDESTPFVDARLPDGSRINAVIPPLAIRGPSLTIRKFSPQPLTLEKLVQLKTINRPMARLLWEGVRAKLNMIVSGGTGSGKTTTLNALIQEIPSQERLVVLEDTSELQISSRNYVCLEARPPNIEGQGEITIQHLVRNALRMRPDRIIVGEVRGPEAFDMLQAMNTGHPGSITTVHANSPMDAVRRIESMVLTAGLELPQPIIREQIASAVDLILQQERVAGGERKVVSISEIVMADPGRDIDGEMMIRELFSFTRQGLDGKGKLVGRHTCTGVQPVCFRRRVT
jgi:pilus assembly protein CpaF